MAGVAECPELGELADWLQKIRSREVLQVGLWLVRWTRLGAALESYVPSPAEIEAFGEHLADHAPTLLQFLNDELESLGEAELDLLLQHEWTFPSQVLESPDLEFLLEICDARIAEEIFSSRRQHLERVREKLEQARQTTQSAQRRLERWRRRGKSRLPS